MNFYKIFKAQKLFLKIRFQKYFKSWKFFHKTLTKYTSVFRHNFLLGMNFNVILVAFETRLNYLYVDR